jgi:hypothetical protein
MNASNADEAAPRCAVTVFLAEINSEKVHIVKRLGRGGELIAEPSDRQ